MGRLSSAGRRAGLVGAAVGVVAVGGAAGIAARRLVTDRPYRGQDPEADEPFGELRGHAVTVMADDDTPIHVEVDGILDDYDTTAVTVVFCHGYALNQDVFHYQRKDLRSRARLVLWDQRGHGRSDRGPRNHTSIDQLGADLRAVLDAVVPTGPVVLVGHSMGGMTVLALAAAHPELFGTRVVGTALLSTSAGRLADVTLGIPAGAGRAVRRVGPGLVRAIGRSSTLVTQGRRLGRDVEVLLTKRYSFASPVPPSVARFAADIIAATPLDVVADFFPAFDDHDKLAALPVLGAVPTLVLVGDEDLLTPRQHSEEIAARVPGAELVVVPSAGHLVILEWPELVNLSLRELVDRAEKLS